MLKWWKAGAAGLLSGVLNGFFGSGGGVIAVPMLKKCGLSPKEAHATSVLLMLVLSLVSMGLYMAEGRFAFGDAAPYLLPGVLGAAAGGLFFKKAKSIWLRRAFGALMIFAAARMLL